jgi:hypothetical protein
MANLGKKDGIFHVRFRFRTKEYKKSLKTRDQGAAEAVCHLIELTIHRLHTGQIQVPLGERQTHGIYLVGWCGEWTRKGQGKLSDRAGLEGFLTEQRNSFVASGPGQGLVIRPVVLGLQWSPDTDEN